MKGAGASTKGHVIRDHAEVQFIVDFHHAAIDRHQAGKVVSSLEVEGAAPGLGHAKGTSVTD